MPTPVPQTVFNAGSRARLQPRTVFSARARCRPRTVFSERARLRPRTVFSESSERIYASKPSNNGLALELSLAKREPIKIMVDWYNTLYVDCQVSKATTRGLWKLHNLGYEVHMVSFCGKKRGPQVEKQAAALRFPFSSVKITREKTGVGGKAEYCLQQGITHAFDDSLDVLTECQKHGIATFCVATEANHQWQRNRWNSFAEAVTAFCASVPVA